jgi:hypothetical protein
LAAMHANKRNNKVQEEPEVIELDWRRAEKIYGERPWKLWMTVKIMVPEINDIIIFVDERQDKNVFE